MVSTEEQLNILEVAHQMVDVIADKKGENIVLMDLRGHTIITDYFLICSGSSERQLKAIVESVQDEIKKNLGVYPRRVDGDALSGWVLLDYNDIIVHAFAPEVRSHYDLEGLWEDAKIVLKMQ